MKDELIKIPKGCTLVHNPKRVTQFDKIPIPRISSEQVAVVVQCIIHDDGPKNLNLLTTTGVIGERGDEYVEFTEDGYQLAAFVRGGMVTNVFYCLTPKGGEYFMPFDGGSPADEITIPDRKILTNMLLSTKDGVSVEMLPVFIIVSGGARPYSSMIYYSEEDAEKALDEQKKHMEKYGKSSDPQLTEKIKAPTIAFKAKSRGLSKPTKTKK